MFTISIITVCYNNIQELVSTIKSVDKQKYKNFEHILINGSSNPNIENYLSTTPQPEFRKTINEPDKGIADAFNKGFNKSTGKFILLLNSGDELYSESVLNTVSNIIANNTNFKGWLHGDFVTERSGHQIKIGKPFEKDKLYRGMRRVCHQTMYVHRGLYEKYGLYNLDEKIGMDYDFLCRISQEPFIYIKEPLVYYKPGGVSESQYYKALVDQKRIYLKYFKYHIKIDLWIIRQKTLFTIQNSNLGKLLYSVKRFLNLENW